MFPVWAELYALDGSVKPLAVENVAEVQVNDVNFSICEQDYRKQRLHHDA